MHRVYDKFLLVPINSIEDLEKIKERDWIYDSKLYKRRSFGRSLYDKIIEEKIGFVRVLVVEKSYYYGCKPLLLEPCGSDSYWTEFEHNRFFKLVEVKGNA